MVVLFLTTRTLTFQCLLLNRSLTKTEKLNLQVSYQKPLQKLLPRRVVEVKKIKKSLGAVKVSCREGDMFA